MHDSDESGGERDRPAPRKGHEPTWTIDPFQSTPGVQPDGEDARPLPSSIGEYRILSKLGEGGMGVVYEAEQQHPRRRVALKVVRGGRFVDDMRLRLFQREADTLARLDHPNIGAIYESGSTEDGQHFFAMELVQGETLGDHLAARSSKPDGAELRYRLELFRAMADAVHYAHQRGVIHRDLKPSNIIVVTGASDGSDEGAVPTIKVLDFGLARIVDADIGDTTMLTQLGTVRGTLPYMSPEQTRGKPEEVDVRTDVYSLGLLLYEMLTGGERPYDTDAGGLVDAARVICEQPPRALREKWPGSRRPDADLETIVAKALEKDPDRRYASAAALSEDVGRYVALEPILARPPSAAYQLRKVIERHKLGFAFGLTLLLVLVGFGIAMSFLYVRAVTAESQAVEEMETAERTVEFLVDVFGTADPGRARGDTMTALEMLERSVERIETELTGQPATQARLMAAMGWVYRGLGRYDEAERLLTRSLEIRRELLGPEHFKTLRTMNNLAVIYENVGRDDVARELHERTLETQRRVLGPENPDTLQSMGNLAVLYHKIGNEERAEELHRETIGIQERILGRQHRDTLNSMNSLAVLLGDLGRYDEAVELHLETLAGRRLELGANHPDTLNSTNNLAVIYEHQGKYEDAEPLYRETLEIQRRVLGEDHPDTLTTQYNLGTVNLMLRRLDEARSWLEDVLDRQRRELGEDHPDVLATLYNLACTAALAGDADRGIAFLSEAVDRGYSYGGDPTGILRDGDLASLKDHPGFGAIERKILGN